MTFNAFDIEKVDRLNYPRIVEMVKRTEINNETIREVGRYARDNDFAFGWVVARYKGTAYIFSYNGVENTTLEDKTELVILNLFEWLDGFNENEEPMTDIEEKIVKKELANVKYVVGFDYNYSLWVLSPNFSNGIQYDYDTFYNCRKDFISFCHAVDQMRVECCD